MFLWSKKQKKSEKKQQVTKITKLAWLHEKMLSWYAYMIILYTSASALNSLHQITLNLSIKIMKESDFVQLHNMIVTWCTCPAVTEKQNLPFS